MNRKEKGNKLLISLTSTIEGRGNVGKGEDPSLIPLRGKEVEKKWELSLLSFSYLETERAGNGL